MDYLRGKKFAWVWLVLRLYVGYDFLTAGWHKITGATPFTAKAFIEGGIAKILPPADPALAAKFKPIHTEAWWGNFLKNFALPNIGLFNFMVQYGELLVGLALIVGFASIFSLTMAAIMNFSFLATGSTSSNPFLFALEFILVGWGGAYVGYIGVDYWFRPMYRKFMDNLLWKNVSEEKSAA